MNILSPVTCKRLCSVALYWLVCIGVFGQVTWRRTYGGLGIDDAHSVRQTADGGYIVSGSTGSFGNGSSDIYVLRLDDLGTPLWSRVYGGPGVENCISCEELVDGYVIAGTTSSGTNGSYDMLLIRTDLQGEPIWEKNYGTSDWDLCNAFAVLPDGFILGGISYGGGMQNGGAFIVRTDLNGDTLWTKKLGGAFRMECKGLTRTLDQGIAIAGSMGTSEGPEDGFLSKLDVNGAQQWITPLGGDSTDVLVSVVETQTGDIVACGSTNSQSDVSQIYLVSVDAAGQFQWNQFIGNTADAGGAEIRALNAGGFVFTGYNTLNAGAKDMILTTVDANGYFQLGNNFGDGNPAEGFAVDATSDGGFVVAGWAEGYGPGLRSVYVVKTDSLGLTLSLSVDAYSDPLPVPELVQSSHALLSSTILFAGEEACISLPNSGYATARITDMRGATLANVSITSGRETSFPVPDLAPGPYMITVLQVGQSPITAKFIIMN